MQLEQLRYISMTLDYFAAFVLSLILVSCMLEKNKTTLLKLYIAMAVSCIAAMLLEGTTSLLSFSVYRNANAVRITLCTVSMICGYLLSFFYTCYAANLVGLHRKICQLAVKTLLALGIVAICAITVGEQFGLYFTVQDGMFVPGRFFIAMFVYDIAACFTGIFLIMRYGQILKRKDIAALFSMPILIFISGLVQYIGFNTMLGLFLMGAVSLIIIYLMIQTDRNRQNVEQEKQLMDMNIAMMLSQIQPHFLYNALSSIRRMIKKDPEVAETAIENFSMYLRKNLESMNRVEPISFTEELKHVEEYLYLEKLRFGDRLCVKYDITYTDFTLPVLTLQPIVENAVKHGIMKKESGGCVTIAVRREGSNVILTVTDDGVGFVPDSGAVSGRLQIGFANVERRIQMQCKGTVRVDSRLGSGTTVTMTIPLI